MPRDIDEVFQGPSQVPAHQREQYIQKCRKTKATLESYIAGLNDRLDVKLAKYEP